MLLLDVNVLLYAHREEMVRHRDYRLWLEDHLSRYLDHARAGGHVLVDAAGWP